MVDYRIKSGNDKREADNDKKRSPGMTCTAGAWRDHQQCTPETAAERWQRSVCAVP
ncbi:MAG: hypothetical protein IJ479_02695 [Alphaproteobacteria bacterium]|nr:hypothetical protein [Alphaproteobacteria bacterium]